MNALNLREDGVYLDATFGRGGHSRRILERLSAAGRLIALDVDPEAIEHGRQRFAGESRLCLVQRNFRELGAVVHELAPSGRVDGILMDLGVSSPQLDRAERGFSFRGDGPLDMRMNPEHGESAADWLMRVSEQDLAAVLREFGEERFARRIAHALVIARIEQPIRTTAQLATLIEASVPAAARRGDRIHPATRSFQAIRIYINSELEQVNQALHAAMQVLKPGGRLVVISFHSLEDRLVKQFMRRYSKGEPIPRGIPLTAAQMNQRTELKLIGKAIMPSEQELLANPRARSAVLRIAQKQSHE